MTTVDLAKSIERAKARLSAMVVQEVSVVGAAANLRRFVVVKGNEMTIKIEKGMKFPKSAHKQLSDATAKALDDITKFAEALAGATIDEGASVPADVGKYLDGVAVQLSGLAKQYGGDGKKDDPVEKRGAKMSKARLEKLRAAQATIKEIMDEVDPEDEDGVQKAMISCPKCGAKNPEGTKTCKDCGADMAGGPSAAEKAIASVEKSLSATVEKSVEAAVEKALAPIRAQSATDAAELKKRDDALAAKEQELVAKGKEVDALKAEIAKSKGETPAPASRSVEGGGGASTVVWPNDMNSGKQNK